MRRSASYASQRTFDASSLPTSFCNAPISGTARTRACVMIRAAAVNRSDLAHAEQTELGSLHQWHLIVISDYGDIDGSDE